MIETLTTPLGGPSLRFLNHDKLLRSPLTSTGKLYFRVQNSCNASFHDTAVDLAFKCRSSFYEVLRVKHDATSNEIKAAYRNLAKVYHPDIGQHDDAKCKFIEIYNAYATLNDPADRAMYDMKLSMGSGSYTTVGNRRRGYTFRRWETDQCW